MNIDADRMLREGLEGCDEASSCCKNMLREWFEAFAKGPECCRSVKITFRNLFGGDCPNMPVDGSVLRGASCANARR